MLQRKEKLVQKFKDVHIDSLNFDDDLMSKAHKTKIYYCSRTHSQLQQFIKEIVKTEYATKYKIKVALLASRNHYCINPQVKTSNQENIWLINEKCLKMVKRSKKDLTISCDSDDSDNIIEDLVDRNINGDIVMKNNKNEIGISKLTKKRNRKEINKKIEIRCQFYDMLNIQILRDIILSDVQDIEELINEGKRVIKACPYYSSRSASDEAQLVVLPYNIILDPEARQANGIDLTDNVLIIDEAHNLIETIFNINSNEINGLHLLRLYYQLSKYMERFEKRFTPDNMKQMQDALNIVENLVEYLKEYHNKPANKNVKLDLNFFLFESRLSNFNIYKIRDFILNYQIANKLLGVKLNDLSSQNSNLTWIKAKDETSFLQNYYDSNRIKISRCFRSYVTSRMNDSQKDGYMTGENNSWMNNHNFGNPVIIFQNFLTSLIQHNDIDSREIPTGKLFIYLKDNYVTSLLKFVLVNPSSPFRDILTKARSVILAGGTMKPFEDYKTQLFYPALVAEDKIISFECGHIIPKKNLRVITLTHGPNKIDLNFSYQNRNNSAMIDEIAYLLLDLAETIPGGIICFFPSYSFENIMFKTLCHNVDLMSGIQKHKKILRESRDGFSTAYDEINMLNINQCVLTQYEKEIKKNGGAILFCVVNGKMSEGINFNDDLARCIVIVGMPYPNLQNPELIEKLRYFKEFTKTNPIKGYQMGDSLDKEYYHNMCMKSVNQCIGRAIRHKQDYAIIILSDNRYNKAYIKARLPKWIKDSIEYYNDDTPMDHKLLKNNIIQFFRTVHYNNAQL
ncbi:ATP-dependent DNA helicase DDX11-like isoform X1 [Gordionus sp. m RMFG-2023]|uniref:ATP-dependent DNA helicase DDX11-like isoform X1 n=1 Tax=Gordionus sp. m RMFG-2023 TaxID=3053472 RepID=UPI0031FD706B